MNDHVDIAAEFLKIRSQNSAIAILWSMEEKQIIILPYCLLHLQVLPRDFGSIILFSRITMKFSILLTVVGMFIAFHFSCIISFKLGN